jgi:CheY-like chemotaxis protein
LKSLLLVDDRPNDLRIAAEAARDLGITEISTQTSAMKARLHLEKALEGEVPLPDGIVLDLDMGHDSGFELLRFWYSTPRLATIPVLIWSVMDREKQICELFKVKSFVSKWEGPKALREELRSYRLRASYSPQSTSIL